MSAQTTEPMTVDRALDNAARVLSKAEDQSDPAMVGQLERVANCWLGVAQTLLRRDGS